LPALFFGVKESVSTGFARLYLQPLSTVHFFPPSWCSH
jgi:hypothetical protein